MHLLVCITGATGYVGRRLANELLLQGHSVRYLSRCKSKKPISGAERIIGDLTEPDADLSKFIHGCDVLFNCLREVSCESSGYDKFVAGLERFADAIKNENIRLGKEIRWIQLSSCSVYERLENIIGNRRLVLEDDLLRPTSNYARTKLQSEIIIRKRFDNTPVRYSILRSLLQNS